MPVTQPALDAAADGETSLAEVGVAVALACDAAPDGTTTGPQPIKSTTTATAPMGLPTNRARCFLGIFPLPRMTPGSGAEFHWHVQRGFASPPPTSATSVGSGEGIWPIRAEI
jgi:hypothetical protein